MEENNGVARQGEFVGNQTNASGEERMDPTFETTASQVPEQMGIDPMFQATASKVNSFCETIDLDRPQNDEDSKPGQSATLASGLQDDAANAGWTRRQRNKTGKDFRVPEEGYKGAIERAIEEAANSEKKVVFEPAVGMVFNSELEAYEFYNSYSWELGFGIKRGNKYVNGNNYKSKQDILCSCEGKDNTENSKSAGTNCRAMVRVLRTHDDGWYYAIVVLEHNHRMAQSIGESKIWKCHNHIDSSVKDLVSHMRLNNVSLTKIYGVMSDMHDRYEDVPFRKRSLRSMCASIAHESSQDDIIKTLGYFANMQAENRGFYFAVKSDQERRVSGLFWCHQKSRADYSCFGDVVTFDTTYKSNLYEMPVGMFIGVNNHHQCCLFGCVILREETVEAFKWAFETFITAMDKKIPVTFLTDVPKRTMKKRTPPRAMFKKFSEELYQSGPYMVKGFQLDGKMIVEHVNAETRKHWCKVTYEVNVDRESDTYTCECGMFPHSGMLFRHVLKVMLHVGVRKIPEKYIMKRWTRDARDMLPEDLRAYQRDSSVQISKTFRHNIAYVKALELVKLANSGVPSFEHAIKRFNELREELMKINNGEGNKPTKEKKNISSGLVQEGVNPDAGNGPVFSQEGGKQDITHEQTTLDAHCREVNYQDEDDIVLPPERKRSKGRQDQKNEVSGRDGYRQKQKEVQHMWLRRTWNQVLPMPGCWRS